jgi:hypothetical protein
MSPAPHKAFTIAPATAEVNANAACQFTVDPSGTSVKWSVKPKIGYIDENGIYSSPEKIVLPQTVVVVAEAETGESATATIELTNGPRQILLLAWYGIAVAIFLGIGILAEWNYLYQGPILPVVIVNPPMVTLDPAADSAFQFTATVLGDSTRPVVWSVSGGGEIDSMGTLHLKSTVTDQIVTVTAKTIGDGSRSGSASVHLTRGKHLEMTPQSASLFPSQQVQFRANRKVQWSLGRRDVGFLSTDGVFTAGSIGSPMEVVQVSAWGAGPDERAAAAVLISRPVGERSSGNWPLVLFVILCGSLGSMIYYTSSFVNFVGNRTFRSSWFWFYISRPFVGGGLAVIFFFVVGSGMINGTTGNQLMELGLVSALVGLFSDKAVKKLSDILDVLLATKDDRKDKVADGKSQPTPPTTAAPAKPAASGPPKIDSVTPPSLAANTAATVQVRGSGFKSGCKVKVNEQEAAPTEQTEQSFKVAITAALVQPPKLTITVTTDQGTASVSVPVSG